MKKASPKLKAVKKAAPSKAGFVTAIEKLKKTPAKKRVTTKRAQIEPDYGSPEFAAALTMHFFRARIESVMK